MATNSIAISNDVGAISSWQGAVVVWGRFLFALIFLMLEPMILTSKHRLSRFQEAGVHGDLITKWVGHTSLKMTSKYTHFSAKHRKEAVAKLGAIAS